jgi:catechol 2,3-dioxygenase-like lactoylglutathione lyase family enzyme
LIKEAAMFLEHVNLTVADLNRSVQFYCQLLGLQPRWRGQTTDGKPAAHIGDDHCYLALFEATQAGRASQDYESPGLNHFGFVIDNLDEAKARLETLGAETTGEQSYEPGRRIYFIDPDGIEVELVEYASTKATPPA